MRQTVTICILFLALALAACGDNPSGRYQGYVEGEFRLIAPEVGGRITEMAVREGDTVEKGALLFALDDTPARAALAAARSRFEAAAARLADAKRGKRKPEIEALLAQRDQAEASLDLAQIELERQRRLVEKNAQPQSALDEARAAYRRDKARIDEISKTVEVARLGDREKRIEAAAKEMEAARAEMAEVQWRLDEYRVAAPTAGRITEVIRRTGEKAAAGKPVVSLLPPKSVKVRFFVPQKDVPGFQRGDRVRIDCDGCPEPVASTVTFIASEVEFTPPVIFSNESRDKLVVMIEAKPVAPVSFLHPGQPVDIERIADDRNGD